MPNLSVGPATNTTANVAGNIYGAWVNSVGNALIGPSGQNVFIGGVEVISAGANSQSSGTINFSNSNGVSFGMDVLGNITASVSTNPSIEISAGTNSQNSGTINFSNANGVSFGLDGVGNLTASVQAGAAAGIGAAQAGTQTQTSGTLLFSNSNGLTFGMSNSSVVTGSYTVPSVAGLISAINVSIGATSENITQLVFANSNNVTFGLSTAGGGPFATVTASVPTQSNQSLGLYAVGNTTQNSSTTLDARTLSFDALGAITWGYSNGSIQVSAPATSSISGTGFISVAVNASTISIGVPGTTHSIWAPAFAGSQIAAQIGNGSIQVAPANWDAYVSASRADVLASISGSTIALSTYAGTISLYIGLYTRNASTLSLASSGSQSFNWTNSSNNNTTAFTGLRNMSVPINVNAAPQDIWIAVMSQTASANTNAWTASNMMYGGNAAALAGFPGSSANASQQSMLGLGVYSVSSNALPGSMAFGAINGTAIAAQYAPVIAFHNVTA